MKKYRLLIFAFIMSFCTSTTVSFIIVFFSENNVDLYSDFIKRFLYAWPTVFFCILFFVPIINESLDKYLK